MFKTKVDEAAYVGNIGIMELIKFKQKATPEQKKKFDDLLQRKKSKEVWNLVQDVTGVKLHKSIQEEQKKDILPVSGDRKSTRLNSSHIPLSRMPSSA